MADGINPWADPNWIIAAPDASKELMIGHEVPGSDVINRPAKTIYGFLQELAQGGLGNNLVKNGSFEHWRLNAGTGFSMPLGWSLIGDDSGIWDEVAPQLNSQNSIYSLAVFNGKLYGGTGQSGSLFEWNGTNAWVEVAPQLNSQTSIRSLAVFNSKLYGGTGDGGRLFEWNGTNAWVEVAPQLNSQTSIRSLAVFNSKLYGGTGNGGRLFEWNGTNAWVEVAFQLNSQLHIQSLVVFNSKLYGGTGNGGRLFEWIMEIAIQDTGERDSYGGESAVKLFSSGSGKEGISLSLTQLKASTSYSVLIRAKATSGHTARLWTVGADVDISETTTSTVFVSLFAKFTTDSTPTDVVLRIGSDTIYEIVWFDKLMIVEGDVPNVYAPFIVDDIEHPSFSVHKDGDNQTGVVTGTWTKLTFGGEDFNTRNNFAANKFTPDEFGRYTFWGGAKVIDLADQTEVRLALYKNGVLYKLLNVDTQSDTGGTTDILVSGSMIAEANGSSDFFELYVWHNHGSDRIVSGVSSDTYFAAHKEGI